MPILLYGIVALAYAVLAFHFWRTRWNAASAQEAALWESIGILAPLAACARPRIPLAHGAGDARLQPVHHRRASRHAHDVRGTAPAPAPPGRRGGAGQRAARGPAPRGAAAA